MNADRACRLQQVRGRGFLLHMRAGDVHILCTTGVCSAWRDARMMDAAKWTADCSALHTLRSWCRYEQQRLVQIRRLAILCALPRCVHVLTSFIAAASVSGVAELVGKITAYPTAQPRST